MQLPSDDDDWAEKGKIDMRDSPGEGDVHDGENRAEQESDCVGFVEEIQRLILDGPLIHRQERLELDVVRQLLMARRRRKHGIFGLRAYGTWVRHFLTVLCSLAVHYLIKLGE